jgi:hypothetical protein
MATSRTSWIASLLVAFIMSTTLAMANDFTVPENIRPDNVRSLEAVFAAPGSSGFGSTVLFSTATARATLDRLAVAAYRHSTGDLWEKWGESAWMGEWRLLHERTGTRDILAELRTITDPQAISSAGMILEGADDPESARAAIVETFDDISVQNLLIHNLGDGGAMSGLLIAARRVNDEATFLVFLMD